MYENFKCEKITGLYKVFRSYHVIWDNAFIMITHNDPAIFEINLLLIKNRWQSPLGMASFGIANRNGCSCST